MTDRNDPPLVSIDERKDPLGPDASRNGKRSSDKGFLAMAEAEYSVWSHLNGRDHESNLSAVPPEAFSLPTMSCTTRKLRNSETRKSRLVILTLTL
jgi:hypothetical protein